MRAISSVVPNTCNLHVADYCSPVAFAPFAYLQALSMSSSAYLFAQRICLHASLLRFSRQKNHSRPKICRCNAPLSGDHGKVPLIENHSTPWRNFFLQTTNRTFPACIHHGSVHVQVRVHTSHNTCSTKHMCCKRLHVCTSTHGLHATSRFHRSRSHS